MGKRAYRTTRAAVAINLEKSHFTWNDAGNLFKKCTRMPRYNFCVLLNESDNVIAWAPTPWKPVDQHIHTYPSLANQACGQDVIKWRDWSYTRDYGLLQLLPTGALSKTVLHVPPPPVSLSLSLSLQSLACSIWITSWESRARTQLAWQLTRRAQLLPGCNNLCRQHNQVEAQCWNSDSIGGRWLRFVSMEIAAHRSLYCHILILSKDH